MKSVPSFEALRVGLPHDKESVSAFNRLMESLEPGSPESDIVRLFFFKHPARENVYEPRTVSHAEINRFIWTRGLVDGQKYMLAWIDLTDMFVVPDKEYKDTNKPAWYTEHTESFPAIYWKVAI